MIKILIELEDKELEQQDSQFIEFWIKELLKKGKYKGEGLAEKAIKSVTVEELCC